MFDPSSEAFTRGRTFWIRTAAYWITTLLVAMMPRASNLSTRLCLICQPMRCSLRIGSPSRRLAGVAKSSEKRGWSST